MLNKLRLIAATAFALCVGAVSAQAATVSITQDLNLAQAIGGDASLRFWSNLTSASNGPFFPLAAGDTFVATVNFRGLDPRPQELTLNDMSVIFPYFHQFSCDNLDCHAMSADASEVYQTGKIEFLDGDGNVIATSNLVSSLEGVHHPIDGRYFDAHAGQYFTAPDLPDGSLTFSGFRYTGMLDAYAEPRELPITYFPDVRFYFQADSYSTNVLTGVPEPATWGLMIAGLGLVGLGLRRRRALSPVS